MLLLLLNLFTVSFVFCQNGTPDASQRKAIAFLIDQYSLARETSDTVLLKTILTTDVDQLVSTGEWRNGLGTAVQGMLKSSAGSPGTRTLTIDKIKLFSAAVAIVDCKYDIQNADGSSRKMWSSFIVVAEKWIWKISAIRNMLPANQ